jgi:hypothetical protein
VDRIRQHRAKKIDGEFRVAIVSEVLERFRDDGLDSILAGVRLKLRQQGWLVVTVLHGYGRFDGCML